MRPRLLQPAVLDLPRNACGASMSYIHIVNWDRYQHGSRSAPWIKNYKDLLHKDEYLGLSGHQRGILHGLWLAYATSGRQLSDNTLTLSRQLGLRVLTRDIESLNHAGFLIVSASKDASLLKAVEKSREEREEKERVSKETPKKPGDEEQIQAIFDHWRERRSKPKAHLTDGRRTKIRARRAEFSDEALRLAIDGVAFDEWPDRTKHDDLTIIFRNTEQVERFLAMADGPVSHSGIEAYELWTPEPPE